MNKEEQKMSQTIINVLIERFDKLEEETGADFDCAKKIILDWAKENNIFKE